MRALSGPRKLAKRAAIVSVPLAAVAFWLSGLRAGVAAAIGTFIAAAYAISFLNTHASSQRPRTIMVNSFIRLTAILAAVSVSMALGRPFVVWLLIAVVLGFGLLAGLEMPALLRAQGWAPKAPANRAPSGQISADAAPAPREVEETRALHSPPPGAGL